MSDSRVAIVILNFNGASDTLNCVCSVEKYNTAAVKFIVVDNGSTTDAQVDFLDSRLRSMFGDKYEKRDESLTYSGNSLPYITLLASKTNDGYARGNNKGIKLALSDSSITHLMILNSDVLFVEDVIPSLLTWLGKLPSAGIVSPLLFKKDMEGYDYTCARKNHANWDVILSYLLLKSSVFGVLKRRNKATRILENNQKVLENDYLEIELPSGSCMLFANTLLNKIKVFDPATFLYYEENIIYKQEQKLGLKNYLISGLKCIHLGATTTKKSPKSFVLQAGLDSADYYLKEYCDMSLIQQVVFSVAKFMYKAKLYLIKNIKEK